MSTTIRVTSVVRTTIRRSCVWGARRRQAIHIRVGTRWDCTAIDTRAVYSTRAEAPAPLRQECPARWAATPYGDRSQPATMSIFQLVRRAASRAFCPSLPMASDSWSSGTVARADLIAASRTSTLFTFAGDSASAMNVAGS